MTLEDIERFADLSGDRFYAHMDETAAKANPFFDGRVAHGYFVVSAAAGLFVDPDPGPCLANYGLDRLRFLKPVYPGDTLTVSLTCKQKTPRRAKPTARSAGTSPSTTRRARRSPPTTSSPWSPPARPADPGGSASLEVGP